MAKPKVTARAVDDAAEEDLWSGTYSGKAMYGHWILAGITTAALLPVCLLTIPSGGLLAWLGLAAVVWAGLGLLLLYRKLSVGYTITTQRLEHRTGILVRHVNQIELIDVDDISLVQGIIQRLFKVGSIRVVSSDTSHPELKMIGIDDVEEVFRVLDQARRDERRRRALHIEEV